MELPRAGASSGGALAGAFGQPTAGQASSGSPPGGGGSPPGGGGASPAHGGASLAEGGASLAEGGATGWAGESGAGGAEGEPRSIESLLGDYDVFFSPPPALADCSPTWYEPRMNLGLIVASSGVLEAQIFRDYDWQAGFFQEPRVGAGPLELPVLLDWEKTTVSPALTLDWDAHGFRGTGFAEIPYTCHDNVKMTRQVPVKVEVDRTAPKLRVEPVGFTLLGFTRFSFTFSEPVALPSGDYNTVFSEPSDGQQALELYDVNTNAALPAVWKWSLGGPVSQAHVVDPAAIEGRTIAARLIAALADRAGNPLSVLGQTFDIQRSAVLDTELDFDHEPGVGMFGNASYHAAAEPGAECEQGGCLVLDGPVVACEGAPKSTFAVRLSSPWDAAVQVRYRVWASTKSLETLAIAYPSGCSGSFNAALTPLAQPAGAFIYASDWQTVNLTPCGGPEYENGFSLSLPCVDFTPPPAVRIVLERITRPQ